MTITKTNKENEEGNKQEYLRSVTNEERQKIKSVLDRARELNKCSV